MRWLLFWLVAVVPAQAMGYELGPAVDSDQGWRTHSLRSEFQGTATALHVLLPTRRESGRRYPVLYLLPVEALDEHRYGSGIDEARRTRLADRYQVICVAPTFSQLPWYADHPTDLGVRQESHFLRAVVPAIDAEYPTQADASGRWLVGFSKSGWGAISLLGRHPRQFSRAGAWDSPLQMDWPTKYGSQPIFGTEDNFRSYRIAPLLNRQAESLAGHLLVLAGHGNFRTEMELTHRQLEAQRLPHVYLNGPDRAHDWHSGWLADVCESLCRR